MLSLCEINAQSYTSYMTGDTANFIVDPTPGILLAGGASDHDNAMKWFLEHANGGDVLIIRASGSDGYNDYLYSDLEVPVNSVETIVFNSASASSDPYVLSRINGAEAIFLAGGDQWNYINYWRNSEVESALNYFINVKGGVIGGTSAGMAVQGGHYFSAQNGTVYSDEALEDPYNSNMTIGSNDFLEHNILSDVITDTHYNDPDRRGRHMTFLARIIAEGYVQSLGIACDEYVAVCIDEFGLARCFGEYPEYLEYVYFLRPNCIQPIGPELCEPGESLTWNRNQAALKVYRANADINGISTFDLNDWVTNSGAGQWQDWWVEDAITHFIENTEEPSCTILNVEDIDAHGIAVYPNPATDSVHFVSSNAMSELSILDSSGRVVVYWTKPISGMSYSVDGLNAGIYIVRTVMQSGEIIVTRLSIH